MALERICENLSARRSVASKDTQEKSSSKTSICLVLERFFLAFRLEDARETEETEDFALES